MLGSNPGLLRLWHWQPDALTSRLDLIYVRVHYPYLQTNSSLHQPCGHILYTTSVGDFANHLSLPVTHLLKKINVVGPWILLCIFFLPISRVEMGCPVTACPKVHRSYSCCNFLQKYTMLIFRNYFSNDGLRKYARGSAVQLSYSASIIALFLGLGFSWDGFAKCRLFNSYLRKLFNIFFQKKKNMYIIFRPL